MPVLNLCVTFGANWWCLVLLFTPVFFVFDDRTMYIAVLRGSVLFAVIL